MRDPSWYDPAEEARRDREGELELAVHDLCREIYGPLDIDRAVEAVRQLTPKYVRDWRLMDNEQEFVRRMAIEELEISGVAVQWWEEEAVQERKVA